MDDLEIITTSDGSHTIRNKALDETYHSIHGAVQESTYVFIEIGLRHFHQSHPRAAISVLEVGFGTGLNALLSLEYAAATCTNISYTSIEPFPLPENIWSQLNYGSRGASFGIIHRSQWDTRVRLSPEFVILKLKSTVQKAPLEDRYDVIFFDAFAPAVQPELWSYDVLKRVTSHLQPDGVFVTYSARGQLKRDLKALGLFVQTLPGPPGKQEMVRAERRSEH